MTPWFNTRKAAQVVAFFAREEGGSINVLKVAKLVYLADRECMSRHEFPVTGDNLVSMDHGPVNSMTLNCINGMQGDDSPEWAEFVSSRAGYAVGITKQISDDDLDELSVAELQVLKDVWTEFGGMSKYEIRDWTHKNCPEWEDPNGSSSPIPFERIFKYLGKESAAELEEQIRSDRLLFAAFA